MKRSILVLTMVLGIALTACGTSSKAEEDTAARAGTPASSPAKRVVDHALGKTEIPTHPQRIVVLNPYAILDYLIALDLHPIGATGGEGLDDYPFGFWLQGLADGVEMLGGTLEPDLEQIALAEPDLILSNPWQEDIHEELTKIAPTVAVPLSYSDYEEEFRYVADIVGRSADAEEIIAAYHEKLEEFEATMSEQPERVVSVIRVFPGSVRLEASTYVTTLLEAAGIQRPRAQDRLKEGVDVSIEQARLIDGDVILIYSADNAAEQERNDKSVENFLAHPLLGSLEAARSGNVRQVDSRLWAGGGILWANAMVDDLTRLLGEGS